MLFLSPLVDHPAGRERQLPLHYQMQETRRKKIFMKKMRKKLQAVPQTKQEEKNKLSW